MFSKINQIKKDTPKNVADGDIRGEYPRAEYFGSDNINYAAQGAKRNSLWTGGGAPGVDLGEDDVSPGKYPNVQTSETKSGHIIETDDTPGNERLLIMHNDGGGIEWKKDGSLLLTTPRNSVQITGADQTIIVEGDGNLIYNGNLSIKVNGDFNVECLNYNVKTKGNKTETINGALRQNVAGNYGMQVTGSYSTTVNGQVVGTYLGGYSQNVKGTYNHNVDGSIGFFASGDVTFTSEEKLNASADNMTLAANDMTVMGGAGTIGGTSMLFSGKGAVFQEGVTAPTFHGDLTGRADEAISADTANYGPSTGTPSGWTNTNTATPAITNPTTQLVSTYLTKAAGGIRKVVIDAGDFLKNFLNKSDETGGASTTPIETSGQARSRMRNPNNKSNNKFMSSVTSSGAACPDMFETTPPGIGRISGDKTARQDAGSGLTPSSNYVVTKAISQQFTPEPQFTPGLNGEITPTTKLGPGISLSKFLGGEDPSNINHIRDKVQRIKIARNFYLHAQILQAVASDKSQFENFRLVVAEGLYRPGPDETVAKDSIAEMKMTGKAVVYDLIDANGNSALEKMYDLALYLKDSTYYEKMILDYDMIDCNGLSCRIIFIMPELNEEFKADFNRNVETQYNGNKLSQGELVEVKSSDSLNAIYDPQIFEGGELYTAANFPENTKYGARNARAINSLHPEVRLRYVNFIKEVQLATPEQDVLIGSATRTMQEQSDIQATGVQAASPGGSWHNYGLAIDLLLIEKNKSYTYHRGNLYITKVREIAIKHGLFNNAGDQSDPGHFVPFELPAYVPREVRSGTVNAIDWLKSKNGERDLSNYR